MARHPGSKLYVTSGTMNSNSLDLLDRLKYAASCGYRRADEDLSALFREAADELERLRVTKTSIARIAGGDWGINAAESMERILELSFEGLMVTERSARRDVVTGTEMAGAENGHQFRRGWRECCPYCDVWIDAHIVAEGPIVDLQLTRTNEKPELLEARIKRRLSSSDQGDSK